MQASALRSVARLSALLGLAAVPVLTGCGGAGSGSAGRVALNFYIAKEGSGSFEHAAKVCSDASGGRYTVTVSGLPSSADQQREQLVRRLAANDSSVDLVGMDVIWTGEFAEAGWIKEWTGARRDEVSRNVLPGPLSTATYRDRLFAAPFTSNSQLLWYRKDRVPQPPTSWAQMVDMARTLPAGQNRIEIQGARYEGYTVTFNALEESAGGHIISDPNAGVRATVSLAQEPTVKALSVLREVATSPAADPSLATTKEDQARLAFEKGGASFEINYPFIYPSAKKNAPEVFKNIGWARYPAVVDGMASRPPLGGYNVGVGAFTKHPQLAFDAATCLRSLDNQAYATKNGGLPPTNDTVYDRAEVRASYPFGDVLRQSLKDAVARPVTPAYNDVSLAVQRTLHPAAGIRPDVDARRLRDTVTKALQSKALL